MFGIRYSCGLDCAANSLVSRTGQSQPPTENETPVITKAPSEKPDAIFQRRCPIISNGNRKKRWYLIANRLITSPDAACRVQYRRNTTASSRRRMAVSLPKTKSKTSGSDQQQANRVNCRFGICQMKTNPSRAPNNMICQKPNAARYGSNARGR